MINKISDSAVIVLLGSFNPGIFHPAFFDKNGLLPKNEIDAATIEVATNDVAIFTMSWVRIEVVGERFTARTNDESKFGALCDLVVSIFHLLEFTPVKQMGINRETRYQFDDEATWHAVGHTLTPKEPWLGLLTKPGMRTLTMESLRDDERKGLFNVVVTAAPNNSVIISFNDHFEFDKDSTAVDACNILVEDWDKSIKRAIDIPLAILTNAASKS